MPDERDISPLESTNAGAGCAPTLIAACGNIQAGDDALGPLVAEKLQRLALSDVEVVNLDIRPAGLVDHLMTPRDTLIIVDAVTMAGAEVGSVVDVDWRSCDRPRLMHDDVLSSHGLSIAHQIDLAEKLGMLPLRVRLIGAVIAGARVGQPAGDSIVRTIDAVVDRIADHLRIDGVCVDQDAGSRARHA